MAVVVEAVEVAEDAGEPARSVAHHRPPVLAVLAPGRARSLDGEEVEAAGGEEVGDHQQPAMLTPNHRRQSVAGRRTVRGGRVAATGVVGLGREVTVGRE